jgi:hypothetical protein
MAGHAYGMRIAYSVAILVAGVTGAVLVVASDAEAVDVAGIVLLGVALVGAVSAVFLEIGLSEDRERAERERRAPARAPDD